MEDCLKINQQFLKGRKRNFKRKENSMFKNKISYFTKLIFTTYH